MLARFLRLFIWTIQILLITNAFIEQSYCTRARESVATALLHSPLSPASLVVYGICFVFTYLRISLAFRIMSSVRRSSCFIYLLILLYYYFRVLSGRSFAFLRASLWATSLVCFF